jgi:hypothetical protein
VARPETGGETVRRTRAALLRTILLALGVVAVAVVAATAAAAVTDALGIGDGPTASSAAVADGRLVVDGSPFFPIMLIDQCSPDTISDAADLGINVFLGGHCPDLSAASHLALIGRDALAVLPIDGSPVKGPALVGWTYPDEPENNGWTSDELASEFAFRRGTADGLVSFLTTSSGFFSRTYAEPHTTQDEFRALARLADMPGFDLYPLGHCSDDLSAVYDAQREFVALAGGAPTFQWIETGPIRPEYCGGFEMTPEELRAEVFLAIAGGARGIGYFTHTWSPDHRAFDVSGPLRAEMERTNSQLEALKPGLVGDVSPTAADSPAIKLTARRAGGRVYVFAVNSLREPVRAQLHAPALTKTSVDVFGERRKLPVINDRVDDTFPPLGVHVYVG